MWKIALTKQNNSGEGCRTQKERDLHGKFIEN